MDIRELFCKRIYAELINFKTNLLKQDKEIIYLSSYKIEVFANLYEILIEKAENESEATLMQLVYRKGSILEELYNGWLKKEDSFYTELEEYALNRLFNSKEIKCAA